MSPVEKIRHDNLGAEHITVLCNTRACTGPHEGTKILLTIHHGYGDNAPLLSPEDVDAAYTVAFSHDEHHLLRVLHGHGPSVEKVNGVSPSYEEHVAERQKAWKTEPHGPLPHNSYGEIYTYIAKSERPTDLNRIKEEALKEEFNVEKRLYHLLYDQFPEDKMEMTRKKVRRKEQSKRKIHMIYAHRDADNHGKNTIYSVRFAYTESGIRHARAGRKKVLAMTSNEWRSRRIVVLNGALEQEKILADFIGQMANLHGKWRSIESLQAFVGQFPDYPQQCFWSAMIKGFFDTRESLYSWVADRSDKSSIIHPILAVLPEAQTILKEEASVLRK